MCAKVSSTLLKPYFKPRLRPGFEQKGRGPGLLTNASPLNYSRWMGQNSGSIFSRLWAKMGQSTPN